jgi:hypothetical protein
MCQCPFLQHFCKNIRTIKEKSNGGAVMWYILGGLALAVIGLAWKLRRSAGLPSRDECSAKYYAEEAQLYQSTHSNWHSP